MSEIVAVGHFHCYTYSRGGKLWVSISYIPMMNESVRVWYAELFWYVVEGLWWNLGLLRRGPTQAYWLLTNDTCTPKLIGLDANRLAKVMDKSLNYVTGNHLDQKTTSPFSLLSVRKRLLLGLSSCTPLKSDGLGDNGALTHITHPYLRTARETYKPLRKWRHFSKYLLDASH